MKMNPSRAGAVTTAVLFAACVVLAVVLSAPQLPVLSQPASVAAIPPETPAETWIANSFVGDIEKSGNTIYLGGYFDYIGPNTGSGVPVSVTTGQASGFAKVNDTVQCAVPDGAGGWYIGGEFTRVGGVARNRIAHIRADGSLDPAWNPDANGTVYSLAMSGSTVYAAGAFTDIGGQPRNYIAALNSTTGAATAWNPGANNEVWTLETSGSTVYAGGIFVNIGGQPRSRIAALDAATGAATGWDPDADHVVSNIEVSGSTIYACGYFANIGGQSRNYIAALDNTTGNATAWDPNASGSFVRTMAVDGATVYAGGNFYDIGGQSRNDLAALDATTGNATAWNPDPDDTVWSLEVSDSTLYVAGGFENIGGQARNYIAAIDTGDGSVTDWNPNAEEFVFAISLGGDQVYVGGRFISLGGETRVGIAALDAITGRLRPWNARCDGEVIDIEIDGDTIYVAGMFTHIGGASRIAIAALDASTGNATAWNPDPDNIVWDLELSANTVYAAGEFTFIGGQARNYLAAIDKTTGNATTWNPDADIAVADVEVSGSTVYAGGMFTHIGGQTRNYIAALDASTGNATAWNPDANNVVRDIALDGSTVYAGGNFTSIGGTARDYVAALNNTTGADSGWDARADGSVYSIVPSDGLVYLGGEYASMGGQARNNLAAVDAATGNATAWNPDAESDVYTLTMEGSVLYAGGQFTQMGGEPQPYFAQFGYPTWYMAEGATMGGFETWVLVQNPGDTDVHVDFTLNTDAGEKMPEALQNVTIPAGSRVSFNMGLFEQTFNLSTRVEARDGNVICERAMYYTPEYFPYRMLGHDSVGVNSPAPTWYMAEGATLGGFETWVLVQNPGADPVHVDFTLNTDTGVKNPPELQGVEIPAGSRRSFNMGNYEQTFNLSTKVDCTDGDIICERAMYWTPAGWPFRELGHDSVGVTAPSAAWYMAEGATLGGFETWVLVQNPGADPVHVDFTLNTDTGVKNPPELQGVEIPAGSRRSFNMGNYEQTFNLSTKVEATDGQVICERAMYWTPEGGITRKLGHDSIGVTAPSAAWYMAEGATMGGFETWVLVQNPGADPVHVYFTLNTDAGEVKPPELQGIEIPAGSRISFNMGLFAQTFNLSTKVTATDGNIICERAMYWTPEGGIDRELGHDSIGY